MTPPLVLLAQIHKDPLWTTTFAYKYGLLYLSSQKIQCWYIRLIEIQKSYSNRIIQEFNQTNRKNSSLEFIMSCSATCMLHHTFSNHTYIYILVNILHMYTYMFSSIVYVYIHIVYIGLYTLSNICDVKLYPITGICPHVKYPYNSADLLYNTVASWSIFLFLNT